MKEQLKELFEEYGYISYKEGLFQLGSNEPDRTRQKEILLQAESLITNKVRKQVANEILEENYEVIKKDIRNEVLEEVKKEVEKIPEILGCVGIFVHSSPGEAKGWCCPRHYGQYDISTLITQLKQN